VKHGAQINKTKTGGRVPLITAIFYASDISIVEMLIKFKANVNEEDGDGETPLSTAIKLNSAPMVELLVKSGAPVNIDLQLDQNITYTPLALAVDRNSLEVVQWLVREGGALINNGTISRLGERKTPLEVAADANNLKIVRWLASQRGTLPIHLSDYDDDIQEALELGHQDKEDLKILASIISQHTFKIKDIAHISAQYLEK
jgi:ankyrin repeat protein